MAETASDPFELFRAAGLYDPASPKAHERRELLDYLLAQGHTAERIIAAAQAEDTLVWDLAGYLREAPIPRLSAVEVARRSGTTPEEVEEVRAVLGVPVRSLDEESIPEGFVQDMVLFRAASGVYGRARTLGFASVLGNALSAMIEAGREVFTGPLRASGATELEMAQANEFALEAWRGLREMFGRLMMERSARDVSFEAQLLAGSVRMAVSFVDLVGSTDWANGLDAHAHSAALSRFEHMAVRAASANGCRVVKFIGDEAMLVGRETVAVATAATALCAAVAADGELPQARGAVGFGLVSPRSGDYFGDVVNLVARATKEAEPGGVVVLGEARAELASSEWDLGAARRVELRGVAEPVELFAAWPPRPGTTGHALS